MDSWYQENLVCPRDHLELFLESDWLLCPNRHVYPIVDGIPVMLLSDVNQTMEIANYSLKRAFGEDVVDHRAPELFLESLGVGEYEKLGIIDLAKSPNRRIDPVVSYIIAATNGMAYKGLRGALPYYPIPNLHLPEGHQQYLLDIGCSWGRWCIAAAHRGYKPIGIDPSLGAIMAANRVARELKLQVHYIVGDARFLPLKNLSIDRVFSYSVLQHGCRSHIDV